MEQQGINVHPCLATVTYLSTNGGPTVVLEKKARRRLFHIGQRRLASASCGFTGVNRLFVFSHNQHLGVLVYW